MNKSKECDFCMKTLDVEKNKRDDKRFCNPVCKNKYHSYKRSYAGILIDTGKLIFKQSKNLLKKTIKIKNLKNKEIF